ncbi:polymorphic toxin-type HINT domain-containing protein [Actinacidiphila epipremni]|uniref:Hint domain-containing protein n=1 Tax=Actinacidiphila epipremni TaxID=2053013 RepID=A0ABX0ZHN2_9ACTN|nr:polymorphic toxin-type HINT domain-containing protein [Actinacidiphila epipremni]NJP43340.1 hypothetical protein [Actinacidiphila epipremni]
MDRTGAVAGPERRLPTDRAGGSPHGTPETPQDLVTAHAPPETKAAPDPAPAAPKDEAQPSHPTSGTPKEPDPEVGKKCSFDPATPVLLKNGKSKPIAEVQVGDQVESADPETGKNAGPHTVTATWVNYDTDLLDVTVQYSDGAPATLHTTANHPFWDDTTHTWTPAGNLRPGESLNTSADHHATVLAVRVTPGAADRYNLTVDQVHTYYVVAGDVPVLVHNTSDRCRIPAGQPGAGQYAPAPNRLQAGQPDSDGMLRGTNATGQTTSRGGFRVATEDSAWDNAELGPNGGRLCPTQGPNCAGEVMVAPRTPDATRDWDVSHNPSWTNRQFDPGVSREEVLDNYQEGTGLECIPCNRGGGNDDSRFG